MEGLSCAVGVAPVKFLAKLASEAAKPSASPTGPVRGAEVVVVHPGEELAFLHPLPVRALWGVGPVTLARLERLGVRTVGDLAALPVATLVGALGRASGQHLHALANGIDPRVVVPDQQVKSISHEETYPRDLHTHEELGVEVVRLADAVGARLRAAGITGRTVTIKVRFGDFSTITRSVTLEAPTDSGHRLAQIGRHLLDQVDPSSGVRLFGLGVTGFDDGAVRQLTLDLTAGTGMGAPGGAADAQWSEAEDAIDAIRARFGPGALGPASLTGPSGLRVARKGQQQWGPDAPSGPT
jgi:DNA polymerase-4